MASRENVHRRGVRLLAGVTLSAVAAAGIAVAPANAAVENPSTTSASPEAATRVVVQKKAKKITPAAVRKSLKLLRFPTDYFGNIPHYVSTLQAQTMDLSSDLRSSTLALYVESMEIERSLYPRVYKQLNKGLKQWNKGKKTAAVRTWKLVRNETLPDVRAQVGEFDAKVALASGAVEAALTAQGGHYPATLDSDLGAAFESVEIPLDKALVLLGGKPR